MTLHFPPAAPAEPSAVLTTSRRPDARVLERAREVKERCGLVHVARDDRSMLLVLEEAGAALCYVVERDAEAIVSRDGRVMAHPGTAAIAVCQGRSNPLLRAVAPLDEPPPTHVVDATLGLARDALHLAAVFGCSVTGLEAAPLVACLAEGGLARLVGDPVWSAAAASIRVVQTEAADALAALPDGAADVVFFDPMFEIPALAAQGFELLRRVARQGPPGEEALWSAVRVASRRVVMKVRREAPAPHLPAPLAFTRRVSGKAVDYLVLDTAELHSQR